MDSENRRLLRIENAKCQGPERPMDGKFIVIPRYGWCDQECAILAELTADELVKTGDDCGLEWAYWNRPIPVDSGYPACAGHGKSLRELICEKSLTGDTLSDILVALFDTTRPPPHAESPRPQLPEEWIDGDGLFGLVVYRYANGDIIKQHST